jgi:hydrogenase maturation protein HypF
MTHDRGPLYAAGEVPGQPDFVTASEFAEGELIRVTERFDVAGVVQGVGFRPFVYRIATELGLDGFVGNDATKVFIEVSGPPGRIEEFAARLIDEQPPLARVDSVRRTAAAPDRRQGFGIVESTRSDGERTLIAPDTAMCADCRTEFDDPDDRRYRHPFITCTNCGPRFTIITGLPYDRPSTTMAGFEMCTRCADEYGDPTNRRYHAQPIACHDCGPTLRLATSTDAFGSRDDPARHAAELIRAGSTVAIKGLGGFHLACDATDDAAVRRLRERKHRPDKPFAVMVPDLQTARRLAFVSDAEAVQLQSPARPVVLLRARPNELAESVAPRNPLVGLMLPSAPIHELLFTFDLPPMVMTSANPSGEPLAYRDDHAIEPLCDATLTHDRPIHVPCDDSVVRLAGRTLLPIRRARGFAPLPVPVGAIARPVLAVGGELKNAFCLASTEHAWMSQHIGDMENLATLDAFERSVEQFSELYDVHPEVYAVDAHPGYATSRWARRRCAELGTGRIVEVQHHHAHIAAVMAEHEWHPAEPIIGFAFDGTGYGTDGSIWGGEVMVADAHRFDRVSHLVPVSLPGGDAAIRHPNRVALAHLDVAAIEWGDDLAPVRALRPTERRLLRQQFDRNVACVPTTSMGRLFDAIASLLDLRHDVSYEAQAAIDLEIAAGRCTTPMDPYSFDISGGLLDQRPVIAAVVDDVRAGVAVDSIARAFHDAVVNAVVDVATELRAERGLEVVALSGGVFQNALLTQLCATSLDAVGFRCLTHHLVPPNDGGLALGQAFVAGNRRDDALPRAATAAVARQSLHHASQPPREP